MQLPKYTEYFQFNFFLTKIIQPVILLWYGVQFMKHYTFMGGGALTNYNKAEVWFCCTSLIYKLIIKCQNCIGPDTMRTELIKKHTFS